MKAWWAVGLSALILVLLQGRAQGSVLLKSGVAIEGQVTKVDGKGVEVTKYLRSGTTVSTFPRSQIEKIHGLTYEDFLKAFQRRDAYINDEVAATFRKIVGESKVMIEGKRNVRFSIDFGLELMPRKRLKEYLTDAFSQENQDEELEKQRKLLVCLELIGEQTKYKKAVIDSYSASIDGLYVPEEKKLYYVYEEEEKEALFNPFQPNIVVIHELVHALQDKRGRFDLSGKYEALSNDAGAARRAIIEGDATYVSFSILNDCRRSRAALYGQTPIEGDDGIHVDYEGVMLETAAMLHRNLKSSEGDALALEIMAFPYVAGGKFMKYAHDYGGWKGVESVYEDPPVSSEQILHPEKYFLLKDLPAELEETDVAPLLGAGAHLVTEGVFGEFGIYTLIGHFLDRLHAGMASAGWGNDRYRLFELGKEQVFVCDIAWDSEKDAEEFVATMKQAKEKRHPGLVWKDMAGRTEGRIKAARTIFLSRGKRVTWVETNLKDRGPVDAILGGQTAAN